MAITEIQTSIDRVRVYRNGASVIRKGEFTASVGRNRFVVRDLPIDSSRDLRISLNPELTLLDVSAIEVKEETPYSAEVRAIDAEIRTVEGEIAALEELDEVAEMQIQLLSNFIYSFRRSDVEAAASDQGAVIEAIGVLEETGVPIKEAMRKRRVERAPLEQKLAALRKRREELGGQREVSYAYTVTYGAEAAVQGTIQIEYFTDSAYWWTEYNTRVNSESATARITHVAVVGQASPEPWNDVAITFYTNRLDKQLRTPKPSSLIASLRRRVDEVAPRLESRARFAEAEEEVLVTGSFIAEDVKFTAIYETPQRVSVPNSRDAAQRIELDSVNVADVSFVTRVELDPIDLSVKAHALATAQFEHDAQLPRGAHDVFLDNGYLGVTQPYGPLADGMALEIPLGEDLGLEMELADQVGKRGESGFFNRQASDETHFQLTLTNITRNAKSVEVLGKYPVADDESITIDIHRDSTKPDQTDVDELPGAVVWNKELKPGETWELVQRFTIAHPPDHYVEFE